MSAHLIQRFAGLSATLAVVGAIAFSSLNCSSATTATGCKQLSATIPVGKVALCQCADRSAGEKTCQEDKTFTACGPCPVQISCPDGKEVGDAVECSCADGTPAQQYCGEDGNLGECTPCEVTSDDAGKRDGGVCNNDGTPDQGEVCDDGNDVETDDCTSSCTATVKPTTNACPGQPVDVWTEVIVSGTTAGFGKNHASTKFCGGGGTTGSGSPDRVYAVTVHRAGTLDAIVQAASFAHALYIRTDCANAATEKACANQYPDSKTSETVSLADVKVGTTYYLWVDGEANSSGTYTIKIRIR